MWCCVWLMVYFIHDSLAWSGRNGNPYGNDGQIRKQQLVRPMSRYLRQQPSSSDGEKKPTKPYNASWYTTSYYSSTEETETTPGTEPPSTPAPKVGEKKKTNGPPTGGGDGGSDHEDNLTDDAWAALPNAYELRKEQDRMRQRWHRDRERNHEEYEKGIYKYLDDSQAITWFNIMCYQMGATLFNAKKNLRDYYRIRYAYYNNKEFEIGYIVHEIVYKYTILLELFHTVQYRYYNQSRFFNIATGTYMVYMYTIILEQAQQIMHLCDVLHEVDKKYTDLERGQAEIETQQSYAKFGYHMSAQINDAVWLEKERERKRLKALRKKLRKEREALQNTGNYSSTRRTRTPKTQRRLPHHYGWSIEYW